LGLLGYYIASLLDIIGLLYVSAGTERLILYVYPSLVIFLSAWLFGKSIPRYLLMPLLLCYLGIALSFGGELAKDIGGRPLLGGSLIFLSALSYALFLVGHGRLVNRIGPQRLGAYAMLAASAAVFVHFAITQPVSALVQNHTVYLLAGLTAVFCTVIPVYLFGYGVQVIGSGHAAIVSSLGPVSTYVLAAIMLGEGTGYLQVTGLGLVLLGSLSLVKFESRLEIATPSKSRPGS
jgi:drug/metabolite transporter (DMT)-like permease